MGGVGKVALGKLTPGRLLFVVSLLLVISGCASSPSTAPAPVVVAQAEAGNAETLQALAQLTELKEELKKLRNSVEEIQFDTENAKRRQQNLFQDLDRRLLSLERSERLLSTQPNAGQPAAVVDGNTGVEPGTTDGGLVGVGTTGTTGTADVVVVGNSAGTTGTSTIVTSGNTTGQTGSVSLQEQEAYDQAFNLLKQSKYQDAIEQFQQLADTWPNSQLADDAYYWMSEARYVNREFESALGGFRTIVTRYPDSQRVPEALLKIGYIQYDIGAYQEAAEIFRDLLARFPGHQVAVSAQTRLRRIEQTIQ